MGHGIRRHFVRRAGRLGGGDAQRLSHINPG
jgi:hypothetical protein